MSTELGARAETCAAEYLQQRGLTIIDRNWRNRYSEIDIVAKDRYQVIHFVEVKYRKSSTYGSGFDYITRDKISRLKRAALYWLTTNKSPGGFQIDVMAVSGNLDHPDIELLENALEG